MPHLALFDPGAGNCSVSVQIFFQLQILGVVITAGGYVASGLIAVRHGSTLA